VKKKFYKCEECEQKFGRRSNAERHSRSIHGAASDIISNIAHSQKSLMSDNRYFSYQKKFEILESAGIAIYNEYDANLPDIFSLNKDDFKIIKIIDQLIKPYDELEKLLSSTDPLVKAFILSRSFDASLRSRYPVRSMSEMVELLRSIDGIKKIAKYNSLIDKTPSDPISDVKEKIKNSFIFQRQNN
jgi:hypothetical protein